MNYDYFVLLYLCNENYRFEFYANVNTYMLKFRFLPKLPHLPPQILSTQYPDCDKKSVSYGHYFN